MDGNYLILGYFLLLFGAMTLEKSWHPAWAPRPHVPDRDPYLGIFASCPWQPLPSDV